MRSEATSNRRSAPRAKSSRTFPEPRWTAVSGMGVLLAQGERPQPLEDDVHVARVGPEVEDGVEVDARGHVRVASNELAEIEPFVPGSHRVALHEAVGL